MLNQKGIAFIPILILSLVMLSIGAASIKSGVVRVNLSGNDSLVQKVDVLPSPSPSETPAPSLKPSVAPVVIYKNTPSSPTPVPIQTPLPIQNTKIDSATHIELCKTKANTFKTQVETALVLDFNQKNPSVVELANASTIYETKIVAIKYGQIKEGDLESNFTVVSNYLTNLHDWAVKQIADYMGTVNGKGSLAYNEQYAKCLNEN